MITRSASVHLHLSMAPLFHMEALLPGSISPKMSSILQSHVYPRVGRVFRALARFKSLLLDALGKTKRPGGVPWSSSRGKKHAISYHASSTTKRSKIASFMMKPHYSSCAGGSSSSTPAKKLDASHESVAWNVVVQAGAVDGAGEYCGYLRWLEEETHADEVLVVEEEEDVDHAGGGSDFNEIDRLAEKFIARCHAKFLLEKQESYRRYQEMMARSV
ncbi:hypothetical protein PR202_ga18682 [Eleusine coracana subsp. coracana]|uniref:Uncharacterized protein n=1 Tax=Eleusine coracana subsp. coracana TaxID=191504 RepID=A0AAV5CTL9_ELECO|nr:hypothetical protein QOZ80_4AG0300370 [Eleusine coracana subsp. coracana]GJN01416.1 hypothetical protein PR202_ga18682 [Eleusine coracana subsp. coracana]